jgi:hypothetical protein
MGLTVDIYKHRGRSFCGMKLGISEQHDEVVVVNANGPSQPRDDAPAVALIQGPGHRPEIGRPNIIAVPVVEVDGEWQLIEPAGHVGPMAGGCFIGTTDGRLGDLVYELGGNSHARIVPLHDRYETTAQYAELSD